MADSFEKTSLLVAVMFLLVYICLQEKINSDAVIDWACKYKSKINWNNFVSIDSLLSVFNKNVH